MYCLRVWLPLLVFMTGASPIYIFLFLTAAYILQKPCVYCSVLLFLMVFTLFDFRANWFEPRWRLSPEQTMSASETLSSLISGNGTVADAVLETASLALSAVNGTGGSVASAVMDGARRRIGSGGTGATGKSWVEVLKGILETRQIQVPCVDVIVRL